MSVLDRVHRTPETSDRTSLTESSSVLAVPDPPVIRRLRIVIGQLSEFATNGTSDTHYQRYGWILKGIVDELLDELAANPEDEIQAKLPGFFAGFGKVMEWCGTGDPSVLPEEIKDYLISRASSEVKSIESGKVA